MKRKTKARRPRRFVAILGFGDNTQWVEPGFVVSDMRERIRCKNWTLDKCLEMVSAGLWKEIKP